MSLDLSNELAEQARVTADLAELTERNSTDLAEIKAKLFSKAERDSDPGNEAVLDLEKRLVDAETARELEKAESRKQLDELRLAIAGAQRHAAGLPTAPKCAGFLGPIDEARAAIKSWSSQVNGIPGERRAITTTTIATAGGLSEETLAQFISFVVEESQTLSIVETQMMRNPTFALDRIDIAPRQLIAATEAAAPAVADGASFNRRTLTALPSIWAEDLSLEFLEDNIEREGGEATIAQKVAIGFGNDLADLAWNGDGATAPFLAVHEGFMWHIIDDNDSDVLGGTMAALTTAVTMFRALFDFMPAQFRTYPGQRIWCPVATAATYADEVASRETQLGDQTIVSGFPGLRWFGIPVWGERFFNSSVALAKTDTSAVMTPDSNLVHGIQRDIQTFAEFVPRKRAVELTIHTRNDYELKNGGIVVLGTALHANLL